MYLNQHSAPSFCPCVIKKYNALHTQTHKIPKLLRQMFYMTYLCLYYIIIKVHDLAVRAIYEV